MKKTTRLMTQTAFLASLLFLTACGGSNSENNDANDKVISGKLLPPDSDGIYFGAFTDFGSHEDDITQNKISYFDTLAGKPIAWSYFSNNWMYNDADGQHQPEIRYPEYNIDQVLEAGKTPFVRLLPWVSPHQVTLYSSPAHTSKTGENLIGVCVDPSEIPVGDVDHHKVSILISKDEFNARQFRLGSQSYSIDSATEGLCANDFSMQAIIDGNWDDELREWAHEAKEDRDDNGDIIPLLVTFTVEMTGSWFPWSGIYNGGSENNYKPQDGLADGPERFRDAYRHIIDLFREEGANNITWFFAPDITYPNHINGTWNPWIAAEWNTPANYYPGDDYIDWVGFTLYGEMKLNKQAPIPTDVESFSKELDIKYPQIEAITSNKPFAILETGMVDYDNGSKSIWLREMFDALLSERYSNIKALNYWSDQSEDEKYIVNYNIDSSEETLTTFRQLISNPRFISELHFSP